MITTSVSEDKEFGAQFLADIMVWISENFDPIDLYPEDELKSFVRDSYDPEDIFEHDELADWAKNNDFVYSK